MGRTRSIFAAVLVTLAAGACQRPPVLPAAPVPVPIAVAAPAAADSHRPVGLRILYLRRGADRPLPTLVFYPAARPALVRAAAPLASAGTEVINNGAPAAGRFPLVLFSHGLHGSPQRYADALAGWAAAGFVVAAPNYPFTSMYAAHFRRRDITNQPADLRYVLARVRKLNTRSGDPLHGRIDTGRVGAVGHSAGGYTTAGLLRAGHDHRLRAAVIMAGWLAPGAFAGPPATVLFLQGTADPVVPPMVSREAYERVPWPKAYVLMPGLSHADYMRPGGRGYAFMASTTLDFLRWTLTGDEAAHRRLPSMNSSI